MGFLDDVLIGLKQVADKQYGGPTPMARRLGVNAPTVSRWLNKERAPSLGQLAPVLDALGARVVFPGGEELTRSVTFAQPRLVNVPPGSPLPQDDRYLAVPLVGMAGAGRGLSDPRDLDGDYLMVLKSHPSVHLRTNLIGVQIGKKEESMRGLINPGDIVVVDRGDLRAGKPPGNIFLVRDPDSEGGAMVKRVVFREDRGRMLIVFYSENSAEYPPDIYDFETDFGGEPESALIGRVVVSFSDMTTK